MGDRAEHLKSRDFRHCQLSAVAVQKASGPRHGSPVTRAQRQPRDVTCSRTGTLRGERSNLSPRKTGTIQAPIGLKPGTNRARARMRERPQ